MHVSFGVLTTCQGLKYSPLVAKRTGRSQVAPVHVIQHRISLQEVHTTNKCIFRPLLFLYLIRSPQQDNQHDYTTRRDARRHKARGARGSGSRHILRRCCCGCGFDCSTHHDRTESSNRDHVDHTVEHTQPACQHLAAPAAAKPRQCHHRLCHSL